MSSNPGQNPVTVNNNAGNTEVKWLIHVCQQLQVLFLFFRILIQQQDKHHNNNEYEIILIIFMLDIYGSSYGMIIIIIIITTYNNNDFNETKTMLFDVWWNKFLIELKIINSPVCVCQRWNRSGFFMTGTGTGRKISDRTGSAGLPVRPVER
jgi:hypothetical protein